MTKVFFHQKVQIRSVQSWPKISKCRLSLVIFCYSWYCCCYFIIGLTDMQRFWTLSCHLQYAEGGRNSSDSLILQLHNSFKFCIFLPHWSSCPPHTGLLSLHIYPPCGPSPVMSVTLSVHSALSSSSYCPCTFSHCTLSAADNPLDSVPLVP